MYGFFSLPPAVTLVWGLMLSSAYRLPAVFRWLRIQDLTCSPRARHPSSHFMSEGAEAQGGPASSQGHPQQMAASGLGPCLCCFVCLPRDRSPRPTGDGSDNFSRRLRRDHTRCSLRERSPRAHARPLRESRPKLPETSARKGRRRQLYW